MPKTVSSDVHMGKVLHEWTISEYDQHERNLAWYIIMLVFGLLLVGYALFTGNFLFALIIILSAIILFLQSQQHPHKIPFKIAELGVIINTRFYPYSELKDFYVIYNPPEVKTLFIETKTSFRPRLRIPLMDEDPNEIRFAMREFLPEDVIKEDEPFSDMIARKWMIH
mgnify:CR=1 FL=1